MCKTQGGEQLTPRKVFKVNFLILIMIFSAVSPVLMVQKQPSLLSEKIDPSFVNQAGNIDFDWWEIEHSTNDVASEIATAVGSDDSVHIAYFDDVNDNIKYAYFDGATWTNETVWSHGMMGDKSLVADLDIAIDSNDYVYISFRDDLSNFGDNNYVGLFSNRNGNWQNYYYWWLE